MDVHFLGTTGYHPNQQQHTMCIMMPEYGIVLDAGTGMFRVRDLLQTSKLSILLSHAHLDHVFGLTFLFDILYDKQCETQVYGEAEKLAALREKLFSPLLFPVEPPYKDQPLQISNESQFQLTADDNATQVQVRWFPVQHPGGAVGYRLQFPDNKSVAYVTDTTAAEGQSYESEIQDVDLLIHECYFPDGLEDRAALTGHSSLTPVIELAHRVNCRQVALVHLNPLQQWAPTLDPVQNILGDLKVTIPTDQQIISI